MYANDGLPNGYLLLWFDKRNSPYIERGCFTYYDMLRYGYDRGALIPETLERER